MAYLQFERGEIKGLSIFPLGVRGSRALLDPKAHRSPVLRHSFGKTSCETNSETPVSPVGTSRTQANRAIVRLVCMHLGPLEVGGQGVVVFSAPTRPTTHDPTAILCEGPKQCAALVVHDGDVAIRTELPADSGVILIATDQDSSALEDGTEKLDALGSDRAHGLSTTQTNVDQGKYRPLLHLMREETKLTPLPIVAHVLHDPHDDESLEGVIS